MNIQKIINEEVANTGSLSNETANSISKTTGMPLVTIANIAENAMGITPSVATGTGDLAAQQDTDTLDAMGDTDTVDDGGITNLVPASGTDLVTTGGTDLVTTGAGADSVTEKVFDGEVITDTDVTTDVKPDTDTGTTIEGDYTVVTDPDVTAETDTDVTTETDTDVTTETDPETDNVTQIEIDDPIPDPPENPYVPPNHYDDNPPDGPIVPPMAATDENGNTTYECPEGYKLTMSGGNYQCLRTTTEGRMRAGIGTRAYTRLRGQNRANPTRKSRQRKIDIRKTESAPVIETTA